MGDGGGHTSEAGGRASRLHDGTLDDLAAALRELGHADPRRLMSMPNDAHYPDAVPVLVRFLEARDETVVEVAARMLTDRRYRAAERPLVRRFATVRSDLVRWAIANAIVTVGFSETQEEVLAHAGEASFGMAREPLVGALHRIRRPEVEPLLISLLEDPVLDRFALAALRQCGGPRALAAVSAMELAGRSARTRRAHPAVLAALRGRLGDG